MSFPRGKSWYNQVFRDPTSKTNKAAVPKLKFTGKNLRSDDDVLPQRDENNISTVRKSVYEQNFLKRILTMVENTFIKSKANPDKMINFTEYQHKLKDSETTREEAILIYNELIALFIILSLYVFAIVVKKKKTGSISINNKSNKTKSKLRINDKINLSEDGNIGEFISLLSKYGNRAGLSLNLSGMLIAALGASVVAVFPLTGVGTAVIFIPILTNIGVSVYLKNKVMRTDLLDLFKLLYSTMFSDENKIPISSVKGELKYWGLKEAQVNALFNSDLTKESTFVNKGEECSICLEDYNDNPRKDIRIINPCHHKFHKECIDSWLKEHSNCPNCKSEVSEPQDDSFISFIKRFIGLFNKPGELAPNAPFNLPSDKHLPSVGDDNSAADLPNPTGGNRRTRRKRVAKATH